MTICQKNGFLKRANVTVRNFPLGWLLICDSGRHKVGKTFSLVTLITKNKPYPCPSKFGDIDYGLPSVTRYPCLGLEI